MLPQMGAFFIAYLNFPSEMRHDKGNFSVSYTITP